MKSALVSAAWIGVVLSATSIPSLAQLRDNNEKQMTCDNGGYDSDRVRHCEMKEISLPSIGRLAIDATPNGGTTVKGWMRGDVLVRARVEAAADTQSAASFLTSQVSIDGSGGQVRAMGPERRNDNSWWSVSYEIFVPQNTDVSVKTHNGGINISDVRGQIRFEATNGGIHLKRVAGEINGSTINGGIQVELAGNTFEGRQMELTTKNGGVSVTLPSQYSAHVQAETHNGRITSDFPMSVQGELRPRQVDFHLGGSGPLIHITTSNGGVQLKKATTQM